jgi:ligand-binding SRPBCC domain-containing protein
LKKQRRKEELMRFVWESLIKATPERVFSFHEQPDALIRLMPPWESVSVLQQANIADVGARTIVEAKVLGPFKTKWISQHTVYEPPRVFEDIQVKGPFRRWRHRHVVTAHANGAVLRDEIDYEPPLGLLGRLVAPVLIQKRLQRLFDYRHEVTRNFCERKDG